LQSFANWEEKQVRFTRIHIAVVIVALLVPTLASAIIIGFEGVAAPGTQQPVGNIYLEGGFSFFNPGGVTDAAIIGQPTQNTSGSDYYTWNSPQSNNPIQVMEAASGAVFDFSALDVGSKGGVGGATFDITGFLSGGGTVVASIVNVSSFQNVVLGWTSLTKVEFQYIGGDFGAIDNLNLSPVPEPTAALAFGVGLLVVCRALRRRAA
jgi:hypothetical protein